MDTIALVMAGGRGSRMRSSGRTAPKPLVRVGGVPLLERNLYPILKSGITRIVVSVPAELPAIERFVRTRASAVAASADASIEVLEEDRPLGNIGCAGLLHGRGAPVIVVYADNLTALDLGDVVARHREGGAAMTLSTHLEPFRLPYGELTVEDGEVLDYREKPQHRMLVCSAVSVLGPAALEVAAAAAPLGLVDLFHALRRRGDRVAEFRHDAPWVDVNDDAAVRRAEELVATHRDAFECWSEPPQRTVTLPLVITDRGLLVRRREGRGRGTVVLPSVDDVSGWARGRVDVAAIEFDDLDRHGAVARHRLVRFEAGPGAAPDETVWIAPEAVHDDDGVDPVVIRALATAEHSRSHHERRREVDSR